jgi:hypothetical protein
MIRLFLRCCSLHNCTCCIFLVRDTAACAEHMPTRARAAAVSTITAGLDGHDSGKSSAHPSLILRVSVRTLIRPTSQHTGGPARRTHNVTVDNSTKTALKCMVYT